MPLSLCSAVAFCLAFGDLTDPRSAIDAGNSHFAAGRFKEARESYDAAIEPAEPKLLADLLHNRAAAAFKLGDYAAARDQWVRAAGLGDAAFEGLVQYNLGNCSYREALDQLRAAEEQMVPDAAGALPDGAPPPEPKQVPAQQIIGLLDRGIERYRDAIRLDASLVDARANMELADQLRNKLKEQATSQPNSQPQSQSGSQPSSQQSGQGDQQQNSSQPSSNPSSQPQSQPSSQQSGQNSGDQKEQNEQEGQPDQPEPQEDPSESQPASRPQSSPQSQPMPETQPADSQPSTGEQENMEHMSRAEFERLLQRVRDAEKMRRQKLRAAEAARQKPVDKDW